MAIQNFSPLQLNSTLTVGVDDTGYDVTFFGDASGEKMLWDTSAANLTIYHTDEEAGLNVFTNGGAQTTKPQLQVGRSVSEYWGVYTEDRNAHLIHRQDETSGTMTTRFDQWDSNTSDTLGHWLWRAGNGAGGSMTTAMTLTQAGALTAVGSITGASLDINGAADISGTTALGGVTTITNTSTGALTLNGGTGVSTTGAFVLRQNGDGAGNGIAITSSHATSHRLWKDGSGNFNIGSSSNADAFKQDLTGNVTIEGYVSATQFRPTNIVTNKVVKFNGTQLDDANITDTGSLITLGSNTVVSGELEATTLDINGAADIAGALVVSAGAVSITGDGSNATVMTESGGGQFLIDTVLDITLDFGGGDLILSDDGTIFGTISSSGGMQVRSRVNNADMLFRGVDDSTEFTALTLDMSDAGTAIFSHDIQIADNGRVNVGSSQDLSIRHDATNSVINNNTGDLYIMQSADGKDTIFQCDDGSQGLDTYFFLDGSEVLNRFLKNVLHNDNVKGMYGTGLDLQIFHDATDSTITNATGDLKLTCTGDDVIIQAADDVDILVQGGETAAKFGGNGGVVLYHNNVSKFGTTSAGVTVSGSIIIGDDGNIGSASDPNAIAIDDSGLVSISGTGVEISSGYLKIGGHEIDDIDVTSEFTDADAHIMSSKAIGARFSLKAGSTSITTLGTIGTGVWNGSVIANAYLDADTAHLSTAQTFTGSKTMGTTVKLNFRDGNSYMHSPTANDLEVVCTDFVLDAATSIALEANTTITGGALSITGDGSNAVTLTESGSGDFTVDAPGDIILDAASNDVIIKDDGTSRLTFNFTNSGHFYNVLSTADKTWGVKGIDGSAAITALSIDMANAGKATFNNDVVAFSDRKLKENIQTLDGKKVLEMRGVSFIRKDTKEQSSGVIAQEMQKVAPELVSESQGTLGVSYGNLVGYLIEAVKDQQKQIDELKELCNGCSK